ncbi:MAG: hypothetical protein FWF76_05025 [Oscillospiraceae bacterium]|nr:hypothetical protein [Oscillospiraceae bacterium]
MAVLMCKNKQIYCTKNGVINKKLCPVRFENITQYNAWLKKRQYLKSNRIAETTVKISDNIEPKINKRRLSLSDCYWVKHENDKLATNFESLTPYLNPFIEYDWEDGKHGSSVPDANLGGSFPKSWKRNNDGKIVIEKLLKPSMVYNEMTSLNLATKLGISACSAYDDSNSICIENMTDLIWMLIPLSWTFGSKSTQKNYVKNRGHSVSAMIEAYDGILPTNRAKKFVIKTTLFDFIVANEDRRDNMSNWGHFKHSETGTTRVAPLYDFNLAHVNANPYKWHQTAVIDSLNSCGEYKKIAKSYLEKWEKGIREFDPDNVTKLYENWRLLWEGLL